MGSARPIQRPWALRPHGTVAVCAPGGPVDEAAFSAGLRWLEAQGVTVRVAKHVRQRCGYLAGADAERLADLECLVRDPDVDVVLFARGGYGVGRILRRLDADEIRESRKLFVGYSDATLLLLFLRERAGLAGIHGPMLDRVDVSPAARERLLSMLAGSTKGVDPVPGRPLRQGTVRGPLVGGNLSLVVASLGTPWEIDTRGAILFLEEVGEAPYRVDRMLIQLRDAGKLGAAAGVAVGRLVDCEGGRYPGSSVDEVIRDVLVPEVGGPVLVDLPFGHVADNHALGFGAMGELDSEAGALTLLGAVAEERE